MNTVQLFVCGDINNHIQSNNFIDNDFEKIINSADYAICNLEGIECERDICGPHQKTGTIQYLKKVGFNLFLLANNHITDGGQKGLMDTIQTLNKNNVDYLGAGSSEEEVYLQFIKQIHDFTFGFINLCEAQGGHFISKDSLYGYAWIGHPSISERIKDLRSKVDFIVCFIHYGLEHYRCPLASVRQYYRTLIDLGADCIVGGHPHVAQGYEYYRGCPIIYSLGNFYFPRSNGMYEDENHSYSVFLKFEKNRKVEIVPVFHHLKEGLVGFDQENPINLQHLNAVLNYDYSLHEIKTVKHAYKMLCSRLLRDSLCGMAGDIGKLDLIKNILRYTIFRKRYVKRTEQYRAKLLLLLFENEVYRYIIIQAIKIGIYEKIDKNDSPDVL